MIQIGVAIQAIEDLLLALNILARIRGLSLVEDVIVLAHEAVAT